MHGGRVEDFASKPLASVFTGELAKRIPALAEHAQEVGYVEYEADDVKLGGTIFPVRTEVMAARDGQGALEYRIAWYEDVTEVRRIDDARREAEERFRRAFEDAGTGMP